MSNVGDMQLAAAALARAASLKEQVVSAGKDYLARVRRSVRHRGPGDVELPRKHKFLWISRKPKAELVSVNGKMQNQITWPKGVTYDKGRNEMKRKRAAFQRSLITARCKIRSRGRSHGKSIRSC